MATACTLFAEATEQLLHELGDDGDDDGVVFARVTRVVDRRFVVARRVSVVSGPDAGAAKPYNPQGSWVHRSASATATTTTRRREVDACEKCESRVNVP